MNSLERPIDPSNSIEGDESPSSVEREWNTNEATTISKLQQLESTPDRSLPDHIERIGKGSETIVYRDKNDPGIVYKIISNHTGTGMVDFQLENIRQVSELTGQSDEVRIGDHQLVKTAQGIPAATFLKDSGGKTVAIIVEEGQPVKDWETAAQLIPVLEEQDLCMKDFRTLDNVGTIEREGGQSETVAMDLGGVRVLSSLSTREELEYQRIKKAVRHRAGLEPKQELR